MAEALKTIRFKTIVDQTNAEGVMKSLGYQFETVKAKAELSTTSVNKFGGTVNTVSRRDLGMFASQVLYSSNITGRLGSQLSNLATGLATGGFIGAAFAGAAALISLIGDEAKTAGEELKKMTDQIQSLFKIQKEGGFFNLLTGDAGGALNTLRQRLAQEIQNLNILRTQGVLGGQVESQANIAILKETIIQLEKIKDAEKERTNIVKILKDAGLVYTEELEKQNAELETSISKVKKLGETWEEARDKILSGIGKENRGKKFPSLKDSTGGLMSGVPVPKGIEDPYGLKEYYEERQKLEQQFTDSTVNVLTSNMISGWETIFGEANSMFEQMAASWAEILARDVFSGLLSMLPGGGVWGFISGLFGGGGGLENARVITRGNNIAQRYGMGN